MRGATERDTGLLRYYDNEGIKLVRLSHRTKKPIDEEWQLRRRPLEDLQEWILRGGDVGWQCGEVSGWIAAADLDWPEARKLALSFLPDTLRGAKGSEEPSQYFYRSVGLGYKKFSELGEPGEIIALKASNNGAGHQVVVAPSVHPDKGPYLFVGGYNPAAIADVDKDELRKAVGMLAVASLIARMPAKIADFLGWERADMREHRRSYWLTDLGNAERFVDTCRDRVLWCPARKAWLLWDGARWVWDELGAIRKLAHKVVRCIYKDAVHEPDKAKQREIAKFATASQNESRIGAMLNEAKPYLAVGMEELDA